MGAWEMPPKNSQAETHKIFLYRNSPFQNISSAFEQLFFDNSIKIFFEINFLSHIIYAKITPKEANLPLKNVGYANDPPVIQLHLQQPFSLAKNPFPFVFSGRANQNSW